MLTWPCGEGGKASLVPVSSVEKGKHALLHALNNCPEALNMRRYNERHDAVLEVISKFMVKSLLEDYQLMADFPQFQPYVFPPPPTSPQLTSGPTS